MSYQAVNWALAQDVQHSAAKFLLVVMAHRADKNTWESFLSVKTLAQCTGQDRKTVIVNIARLVDGGFITDTKRRVGETGQIPVYLINGTKNGTVSENEDQGEEAAPVRPNSTEIGTAKDTKSAEFGTVSEGGNSTVFPANSTKFPMEQSQISLETVPNLGHGIRNEITPKKKEGKDKATEIPGWVPVDAWNAFVEMRIRIKKPMTEYAKKLAIGELKKLVDAGQEAEAVVNQSVLKGWQSFFAVKTATNGKVNRHGGFDQQDYRSGVADDGSF